VEHAGVVAFAFGVPTTIRSNQLIAVIACQKAEEIQGPLFTQRDVPIPTNFDVEYVAENPASPPPTLRIARGAAKWAIRRQLKELWISAAEPHVWRCFRDLERALLEQHANIRVCVCTDIRQYPESDWYCTDSEQVRTRTKKSWVGREGFLQILPFFIYRLIAH
jgi:hypothetical protein